MPPEDYESPAQAMKRIEAELQLNTGANRDTLYGGYSSQFGGQAGPLSGRAMVAADPRTGAPTMVRGTVGVGPVSVSRVQPMRGPASHSIEVGGRPFDADTYFGGSASTTGDYGLNVGRGNFSANVGYNPQRRDVNAGLQYQTNFAKGGSVNPAGGPATATPAQREAGNFPKRHESVQGMPLAIENPKGSTRIRTSGPSKMAADYGQITGSAKDADKMDVDAYVGPHHDSKKVFVINQQHPHTGAFNEHKVMVGYKDRSHAVHDYVHSFADGLGHKRIQSIVEMDADKFKGWLKHGKHTVPLKKAKGGPITPQEMAAQLQAPEDQGASSPSWEGIGEGAASIGRGAALIPGTISDYASEVANSPDPQMRIGEMLTKGAESMYHGAVEDPAGFIGGALPVVGNILAGADVSKIKDMAAQARAAGDEATAAKMDQLAAVSAASIALPAGAGLASKAGVRAAEKAAAAAAEKAALTGVEKGAVEGGERAIVSDAERDVAKAVEGEEPKPKVEETPKVEEEAPKVDDATVSEDASAPDEHSMGVERQDRVVMDPAKVKLTKDEKSILKGFKKKDEKAQIDDAIRQTKARHPTSDGWAPMEAVSAAFDEEGNPSIKWKEQTYGYNKAETKITRPVIDPETNKPMKKPLMDSEGNPVLDEDGNQILTNKNVTKTEKVEKPLKAGTPEYDEHLDGAVQNGYEQIMNVVQRAESGDEAAKVMLRQLGWYREFMRKGFDERGGAYPAFSDLLGATSPNTAVDQNYRYAVEAQQRFGRGDFDPKVQFAKDYEGSMADFPPEQLIRREDIDPKTQEFKQYGMNSRNAQMAMADRWREKTPGQAPKARNFSGNLGGATDAATIDVWAARHVNRMMGRDRLPPTVEKGVQGKLGSDLQAGGEFGFGQDYFQRLSDRLNQSNELKPYLQQLGYENVTPMDLQALAWFLEKEHWTKNNWTTKSGEGGSFEQELAKYPSNRWQSGFSITQDKAPLNEQMAQTRQAIENTVKDDNDVMVSRVHPTYGQYGGEGERSFDVELTAKPNWDPKKWMSEIITQARDNNQKDVFFSKRLDPNAALKNPNARPGAEIYFQDATQMNDILPILQQFTKRGQDGFTFTTGLRHQERISGGGDTPKKGFVPDYVGVRLQYVPEIQMRFDDEFRQAALKDPKVLKQAMEESQDRMMDAINAIASNSNGVKVVDARLHHYDTVVIGKESYDQFLNGLANPDQSSSTYAGNAAAVDPKKRLGQPIQSHVEGRDRALARGDQERPADTSGAMERPDDQVKAFARGGQVSPQGGINVGAGVAKTAGEINQFAQKGQLDQRKIAYLLRAASTGTMPADVAHQFAGEIMNNDVHALLTRFARYPRAIRVLARLDLALGGLAGQSLGIVANQRIRTTPVGVVKSKVDGYAKGGHVKKGHAGDAQAFSQFSDYAMQNYGPQIGGNMVRRSNGNAAKLMFALQQYAKNMLSTDPAHAPQAHRQIAQLNALAKSHRMDATTVFNHTNDALATKQELSAILKSDHNINPAFKAALDRMTQLVGTK